MSEEFRTYRHKQAGFALPVPATWEVTEDVPECALVAAEPPDGQQEFRANIVVTVEDLAGESPETWVQRSRDALTDVQAKLLILDTEETEIGGTRAWRTLSHYLHQHGRGVALEQWAVAHDGVGYVLSCTMLATDYDAWADAMAYLAEGLHVEGART